MKVSKPIAIALITVLVSISVAFAWTVWSGTIATFTATVNPASVTVVSTTIDFGTLKSGYSYIMLPSGGVIVQPVQMPPELPAAFVSTIDITNARELNVTFNISSVAGAGALVGGVVDVYEWTDLDADGLIDYPGEATWLGHLDILSPMPFSVFLTEGPHDIVYFVWVDVGYPSVATPITFDITATVETP